MRSSFYGVAVGLHKIEGVGSSDLSDRKDANDRFWVLCHPELEHVRLCQISQPIRRTARGYSRYPRLGVYTGKQQFAQRTRTLVMTAIVSRDGTRMATLHNEWIGEIGGGKEKLALSQWNYKGDG